MAILFAALSGILFSEIIGYIIHRVLHSSKIEWLTNAHMTHHKKIYPVKRLRSETYEAPPHARLLGIGLEWLIPIGLALIPTVAILLYVGASTLFIVTLFASSTLWALFFLSWMHDQFHLFEPRFRKYRWFKKVRLLHDRHHINVDTNFGISFFSIDRLFNTYWGKSG